MYLAIGLIFETGATNSMLVSTRDKDTVFKEMRERFEMAYDFESILLIENGTDCPNVIEHWFV